MQEALGMVETKGLVAMIEAAAMPSFISPFQWRIILHVSNAYEMREVNLLDDRLGLWEAEPAAPWRVNVRYPNLWTPVVARAAATHVSCSRTNSGKTAAIEPPAESHNTSAVPSI